MTFNTRPIGLVFKQHPRDPANVNVRKNMCDPYIIKENRGFRLLKKLTYIWIGKNPYCEPLKWKMENSNFIISNLIEDSISHKKGLITKFIRYLKHKLHCCTLPDERCLSHSMCLYQVWLTLYFLNDLANDAESTQKSKITSLSLV